MIRRLLICLYEREDGLCDEKTDGKHEDPNLPQQSVPSAGPNN